MSVNIEYIGARRDTDYAKKIGCVEGTRELSLTYNKAVIKKITGKDRDNIDDIKSFVPIEIRVSVPVGKSIRVNNIQYNFIPETDYKCEVNDLVAVGYLLSKPGLFRKVSETTAPVPKPVSRNVGGRPKKKGKAKLFAPKPKVEEPDNVDIGV